MRIYEVQPGDSPAGIASRDTMAGCPKCAIDLVRANPHKPAVAFPNGYATFKSLVPGEKLNLPDKWFNGDLDSRPTAYFAALPYADGVTPSTLGAAAAGVLADYAALDTASAKVSALAAMGDQPFHDAVESAAAAVDASVQDISGTAAQDVKKATARARASNTDLAAAIAANNDSSFNIRNDILHDFSDSLSSAKLALQAFHGSGDTPAPVSVPLPPIVSPGDSFPTNIVTAAHAAADAIAADPHYCASVAQSGSAVNAAVHAFKMAWNSSQSASIPIGTSSYEQQTADALAKVIGASPTACAPHVGSTHPVTTTPVPVAVTSPQSLSTGAMVSIGLLGAGVVGGAVYLTTRKPRKRRRR